MSVISIFSGVFCKEQSVVAALHDATGLPIVRDAELVALAAKLSGLGADKIEKAFSAKTSVFNKFTHEKQRAAAWLRLALATRLAEEDRMLLAGFTALLPPREIAHVLRVCLIADAGFRRAAAAEEAGLPDREAQKALERGDEERALWAALVADTKDPWSPSLYDIVVPMDKTGVDEAAGLITRHAADPAVRVTDASRRTARDFLLAARVETAITGKGHDVAVSARDGVVILTINKKVLLLDRLENELRSIATKIDGVSDIVTKVGKGYYQTDIYRRADFEMPTRVLLVDDEREFVQTLSERLSMREVGSHVVFDGESALEMVADDEPEVMVLDLKMPGIDGLEVLKRTKATRPDVEIIILTGHGSEADRDECMRLGAFAYLQKPVDIEQLSDTLKRANEKVRAKKAGQ
ncbi:response regulator receiver protein [Solidesulfovibrio carbinoliphilus subsp. oakridgensis]|uniref:Response regulator receiver protein n=1 Tax=Solidesulfovibrio carbinoliphilus subsp. oakridgensis TaxID=694327 RepID=G7Q7B7_9BACT|nr:response regulator [Solidesulfovibrio carbinoliphilus]EHJ49074.1 response regulator receiver protein [Solidesulfovibrio carbinoliphilus subsp. oakridgensis]